MPAISHQHIHWRRAPESREKPLHLRQRRGKIRVHEKRDLSARPQHSTANREAFSPLRVVADDGEFRMPLREAAREFQSAVTAALDDEDDFVAPAHRAEIFAQRPNARLEAVNLVIGGYDD